MKIAATAVSMDAAQSYKDVEHYSLALIPSANNTRAGAPGDFGARLASFISATTQSKNTSRSMTRHTSSGSDQLLPASGGGAVGLGLVLSQVTEQLTGQTGSITTLGQTQPTLSPASGEAFPSPLQAQSGKLVTNIVYSREESLLFSAQGSVQTTDGRDISFDFGLSMTRTNTVVNSTSLGMVASYIDPLLLQFDGQSPLLTDCTFLFDLNGDGTTEELACPGKGCGFLAFDRNGDGCINNGLELFGPASGSGFGELALLDSDANLWIDENDPLFDRLSIWNPQATEGTALLSLRQAGVGALAVVHAGSDFELQSPSGAILGRIKANGIFLTEKGEVRSLQEIDLASADGPEDLANTSADLAATVAKEALLNLRTIIDMQRLRLQLMLSGQHLERQIHSIAPRSGHRDQMFQWLDSINKWQSRASAPLTGWKPQGHIG